MIQKISKFEPNWTNFYTMYFSVQFWIKTYSQSKFVIQLLVIVGNSMILDIEGHSIIYTNSYIDIYLENQGLC